MPARKPTPTLRLRRLAAELPRLRSDASLTREDVTERTGINGATLYRIESAKARPQTRTLRALLELYGVAEDAGAELVALARQSEEQSWLQSFPTELPEVYTTYISFEGEARALVNYECLFVPGLLQTEEYARAALQRGMPTGSREEVQRMVEARLARQAVLTREPPLRLWAIVDEGALHRPVGGHKVMADQLQRLAGSVELPHVTLQVIPYGAGAHPGMAGSFVILQFGDEAADVAYIESQAGELFLEGETDVARFSMIFDNLRALALPPDESAALVTSIAHESQA